MKLTKTHYWVIGIVILVIIIFIYVKWFAPQAVASTLKIKQPSTSYAQENKTTFPLQKGSQGPEVKNIQHILNIGYGAALKEDGIWGPDTDYQVNVYFDTSSISKEDYDKLLKIYNVSQNFTA